MKSNQDKERKEFYRSDAEVDLFNSFFAGGGTLYGFSNPTLYQYLTGTQNINQITVKIKSCEDWIECDVEKIQYLKNEFPLVSADQELFLKLKPEDDFQPHIICDETARHKYWLIKSKVFQNFSEIKNSLVSLKGVLWTVEKSSSNQIIFNAFACFSAPMRLNRVSKLFPGAFVSGIKINICTIIHLLLRNEYKLNGPFLIGNISLSVHSFKNIRNKKIKEEEIDFDLNSEDSQVKKIFSVNQKALEKIIQIEKCLGEEKLEEATSLLKDLKKMIESNE